MKKHRSFEEHWITPDFVYRQLDDEFNFDFDPCPILDDSEINDSNNGLSISWGKRNFVNPPYAKISKEGFIAKAIEEFRLGKLIVLLLPVSTSTIVFHDLIFPNVTEIRFIKSRISFIGINSKGEITSKGKGMADSMICIFDPSKDYKRKLSQIIFHK